MLVPRNCFLHTHFVLYKHGLQELNLRTEADNKILNKEYSYVKLYIFCKFSAYTVQPCRVLMAFLKCRS